MALLEQCQIHSTYGNPEITKVNIGVGTRPGILVSGHDLRDLENVAANRHREAVWMIYTHSEMLPSTLLSRFQKNIQNFVGNYGNAWWKQKEEFESFHGPILMTTNCIVHQRTATKTDYTQPEQPVIQVVNTFLVKLGKKKTSPQLLSRQNTVQHQKKSNVEKL